MQIANLSIINKKWVDFKTITVRLGPDIVSPSPAHFYTATCVIGID
jgi:hypothetical protein